jgi:hypothetical protein
MKTMAVQQCRQRKKSQKTQQKRLSSPKTTQLICNLQHTSGILVIPNLLFLIQIENTDRKSPGAYRGFFF